MISGVVAEIGRQVGLDGREFAAVVVEVDIETCRRAADLLGQAVVISVIEHRSSAPAPAEAFGGALDSDARAAQDTHYAR